MQLNFEGIAVGAASLLIIGAFHPLVIWCEYHFTQRVCSFSVGPCSFRD